MIGNTDLNVLINFNQQFTEMLLEYMDYFLLEALSKFTLKITKVYVEMEKVRYSNTENDLKGFSVFISLSNNSLCEIRFRKVKDYSTYESNLRCVAVSSFLEEDESNKEAIKYMVNKINNNPKFYEYMVLMEDTYFSNRSRIIAENENVSDKLTELSNLLSEKRNSYNELESIFKVISEYVSKRSVCSEEDLSF